MLWINTAIAALALGVSAAAFSRTLFLDKVVADLVFVWDATLDRAVGKLVIENPLRYSLYLSRIRFLEPARRDVIVRVPDEGLHDVIRMAIEDTRSAGDAVATIYARIPPKNNLEIEFDLKRDRTGLRFALEWSAATPWAVKLFLPNQRNYSPNDVEAMKLAAKRGAPPNA